MTHGAKVTGTLVIGPCAIRPPSAGGAAGEWHLL